MTKTLAIVNQKGGVGKTTTAVNVAACLSKIGKKTLIVDLDPQGNAGSYLGINIASLKITALEVLNKSAQLKDGVIETGRSNLFILPANIKLGSFNQGTTQGRTDVLKNVLNSDFARTFDFIIIDCQPSLSLLTINAMAASNGLVIAMQAEYLALDGLSQLLLTLKEVKQKMNVGLTILGIAITMYDRRNNLCVEVKNELVKNMPKELFKTVIPRVVKLAESPSHGKTIFEYDQNGLASHAYRELTLEIVLRLSGHLEE
jgi:chromosome partitioning protein